jgi:effector-binding domain-containing protein
MFMKIKEVKPINFLFFRAETTVAELPGFLNVAQNLFDEAVRYQLLITGPVHWHYYGFTGDMARKFTLEISLPVSNIVDGYDGEFHFKRTEPFKCVSEVHEGSWYDIPVTYQKLMSFIGENNLNPVHANREIYVNVDFNDPTANTTEVQVGIQY